MCPIRNIQLGKMHDIIGYRVINRVIIFTGYSVLIH